MENKDNENKSQNSYRPGDKKNNYYRSRNRKRNHNTDKSGTENQKSQAHQNPRGELKQLMDTRKKLSLYTMVALLIILGASFFYVVRFFFIPVMLAMTFTILFYPLYRFLLKGVKNKNLASLIICTGLILLIFIPMYFIGLMVILQLKDLGDIISAYDPKQLPSDLNKVLIWLESLPYYDSINLENIDWPALLETPITTIGKFSSNIANKTFASILAFVANLFLILFTMFFFFRDGQALMEKMRYLSPLLPEYEDKLIERSASISRATIKGTVVIGLTQGIIGAITLAFFGIKGWFLWGVVMIILSIIPIVGSYFVLIPVAGVMMANGRIWQGIVVIVIAIVVNYAVDYIMRPSLVGAESKVHDLIIFCSTLGGIAVFGVMGFIIGPFIAVLFVTILDIYGLEFKEQLSLERHIFQTAGSTIPDRKNKPREDRSFFKKMLTPFKGLFNKKKSEKE